MPLADIPAYGDVKPWQLAVALDVENNAIRIGLQPDRDKSGAIVQERQTGTVTPDGMRWTGRAAEEPGQIGRRLLCRADRRTRGRIPVAPDSGSQRRLRRHGPVHRPGSRDGRRFLVRRIGVQPRDPGATPARVVVQAVRLRGGARQRLHALLDRSRRAGHDRSGQRRDVEPVEFRGHLQRAAYPAVRRRAFDQPDDRPPRARPRHAARRRIRQTLRHLRQSAAVPVDVDRRRRDDRSAHGDRLFDVRQRRQEDQGDPDRPHPGPLGQHHLQA